MLAKTGVGGGVGSGMALAEDLDSEALSRGGGFYPSGHRIANATLDKRRSLGYFHE